MPVKGTELEIGVLCSPIKNQRDSQLVSLPCSTSLPGLRISYDKQEISFAIAAYSEDHTNKKPALFTMAFLRHECWPIAFLMIWPTVALSTQVLSSCF